MAFLMVNGKKVVVDSIDLKFFKNFTWSINKSSRDKVGYVRFSAAQAYQKVYDAIHG